jgi:hypothetical protein
MATLTPTQSHGGHWYSPAGRPVYEVEDADGGMRPTTLRDARKLSLVPSVTTVISQTLAKPSLDRYKADMVILATLHKDAQAMLKTAAKKSGSMPKLMQRLEEAGPSESRKILRPYLDRVRDLSNEHRDKAAGSGTNIHNAMDLALQGEDVAPDALPYIQPAVDWIRKTGLKIVALEKSMANTAYGYGGRVDFLGTDASGQWLVVLDYKTTETDPEKPDSSYTPFLGQSWQLAAYLVAWKGVEALKRCRLANLVISRSEPGRFIVNPVEDPEAAWLAFYHCLRVWQLTRNYQPAQVVAPGVTR